jgi:hypothetical protein
MKRRHLQGNRGKRPFPCRLSLETGIPSQLSECGLRGKYFIAPDVVDVIVRFFCDRMLATVGTMAHDSIPRHHHVFNEDGARLLGPANQLVGTDGDDMQQHILHVAGDCDFLDRILDHAPFHPVTRCAT